MVTNIATHNKEVISPQSFSGLSSLFLLGDFADDLNPQNYEIKLGARNCEILSIEAETIECLIPSWNHNDDGSYPNLEVLHNSVSIYSYPGTGEFR